MSAYYNENDPKAAAWLRELISAGLIAKGDVDERSIVDVRGSDLAGYAQCHFFAGIGGWSCALRLAGWPDDKPAWTGSCPCQPFSAAGKQTGEKDTRHLWPDFWRLISESAPHVVFGEQVANSIGFGWIDGVRADVETKAYALGVAVLGSHSVGAPHIRQRLYWVADAGHKSMRRPAASDEKKNGRPLCDFAGCGQYGEFGESSRLGHADDARPQGRPIDAGEYADQFAAGPAGSLGWLAVTDGGNRGNGHVQRSRQHGQQPSDGGSGFWDAYDIVHCTDNKARRIEPGTFPLAHGIPARMGRLRGYGNAITPEVACEFVIACMEIGL